MLLVSSLNGVALVRFEGRGIGIVLFIVSLVLEVIISGYLLYVGLFSMKESGLPSWKLGSDFFAGLKGLAVGIVYFLPALILFIVVFGWSVFSELLVDSTAIESVGFGGVVAFVVALLTVYVLPIALLNFMKNGFTSAFDITSVAGKAFTLTYAGGFFFIVLYMFIAAVVLSVISTGTLYIGAIGTVILSLLTALVMSAVRISAMSVYGALYRS